MGRTPDWSRHCAHHLPLLILMAGVTAGCNSPVIRSQSPDSDLAENASKVRLVGDMAVPWGMRYAQVEGIAMVNNLSGTGSDPPPSSRRRMLIDEMRKRGVHQPNQLLASPATSLVIVTALLPPGARKGDRIDVRVQVPSRSKTENLHNGWLMQARLKEMAVMGNQIHEGHDLALAEGPLLVDAFLEGSEDPALKTRGWVLGGGMILKDRSLGLALKSEHHSIRASTMIAAAINQRFHTFDRGIKRGAATPTRDNFIELAVQPRYRNHLARYIRVVQAIAVRQSPQHLVDRLMDLEAQLLDADSALAAALQLEAIGDEAVPVLAKGLQSSDPLVRFYAAEALAYLDQEMAVKPLAEACRNESAFRWHALTALSAMDALEAHDALSELLHVASAETRYGAFRALQEANPYDPLIRGEVLNDEFMYHEVATSGEPMIHVRRTQRPEIVTFGTDQQLTHPFVLSAGKRIMIRSIDSKRVKVMRFAVGEDESVQYCPNNLRDIVHMVSQMGGAYADVVSALIEAKRKGAYAGRLKFDALPSPGRKYHRGEGAAPDADQAPSDDLLPSMFARLPELNVTDDE